MPWLAPAYPAYSPTAHPYLTVRPLTPLEDGPLHAVFQGLSARSRQMRYHAPLPALRPTMVRHLTALDPDQHVAFVAALGGTPVGIIRWMRLPNSPARAEIAVEVVDRWHGAGVGTALLGEAARSALRAGITAFVAYVDPANSRALAWARALGATAGPDPSEGSDPSDGPDGPDAEPDSIHIPVAALALGLPRHRPAA